jgi:hypothetical protein
MSVAFLNPLATTGSIASVVPAVASPKLSVQHVGNVGQSNSSHGLAFAAVGGFIAAVFKRKRRNQSAQLPTSRTVQMAAELAHGEDISVPADAFIVIGLAHCFEQADGKLIDKWVLEPVTASTVEVVDNGAATSYEAFLGTTVGQLLSKDISALPTELLCGHSASFSDSLEFRTGCAARTWMRDHARDIVRKLVPVGVVKTGFNTSTEHKRILNFVHEVKDSDNIKQDMSIDVYGRSEEENKADGDVDSQVAALYNV